MKKTVLLLVLFSTVSLFSQSNFQKERSAIKNIAGCYDVTYQFAETFATDSLYSFHERHKSTAREWITVEEETENRIVLQHVLISDDGELMKHWREDWVYENTEGFSYSGDHNWNFITRDKESVKGQWTQKVMQVDDSPRYEGSATWNFSDGKITWSSSCLAPLPRREYTTRSDYKVLKRQNTYTFTGFGYTHEEDNVKFIVNSSGDTNFVMEKGLNTYKKIDDSYAVNAEKWWKENRSFWAEVRKIWAEIYGKKTGLSLYDKVGNKTLFGELLNLARQYEGESSGSSSESNENIRNLIYKYIRQ